MAPARPKPDELGCRLSLPGEIKAAGYATDGRRLIETRQRTAGAPTALRLRPVVGGAGMRADGADMAMLEVEVVDSRGNRCPTALNLITFGGAADPAHRAGVDHQRPQTRAQRLRVAAAVDDSHVRVTIGDDGVGNDVEALAGAPTGRGLRNLQQRALQLGAHIETRSGDTGTIVTLVLPIDRRRTPR